MPDDPVVIQVNYANPRGQVAPRPRPLRLKQAFEVRSDLPGDLSIEFTGASPFNSGSKKMKAGKGQKMVVEKTGKFAFKCTLNQNGNILELGNPADPNSGVGGELDVGN